MTEVFGNRYEVIERVGDGGMATVFRGTDRVLKRDVAIKVMHPHLAARADARQRFNREATSIARLHHSNIVDVYDFSVGTDDEAYLITEFVHGETLTAFVSAHGPFLPQAAALIGHAVAAALGHAHAVGIVHRDIKPDNLMISRDGQIKLMDFGIATAMDMEQMTATGAIVGSPAHMAPEQIEGGEIDHRCDIFALGTVLYHLVTRRLPFVAGNPHALFRLILEGKYDQPSKHNPQVDRAFDAIIAQCLARQKTDRYATMETLQSALTAYLKHFRMSDVSGLLQRFLKAPEVFQFDLKPTLVQVLTIEGRRYAEQKQLALAIDAFNRALVIDPEAEEPKKALTHLTSRSQRRRRWARVGAVAGGLFVLGGGSWWAMSEPPIAENAPPLNVTESALTAAIADLSMPPERLREKLIKVAQAQQLPAAATPVQLAQVTPEVQKLPVPELKRDFKHAKEKPAEKSIAEKFVDKSLKNNPEEVLPTIRVRCGSDPTNAEMYVDGAKLPEIGIATAKYLPGSEHTLECRFPDKACDDKPCPKVPPRKFRVPAAEPNGKPYAVKCSLREGMP